MSRRVKLLSLVLFLFCLQPLPALASSWGTEFTYPLVTKDPSDLHGYRVSLWYQPPNWIWKSAYVYLDGSFGHWWVNDVSTNREVNIYAIAPLARFFVLQHRLINPFFDLSIGLSYLTKTRLDDRNLGEHFSFQDQVGVGAAFGHDQRLTVSFSALHYSNGSFARMNAGITIPLLINIGYRL